MRRPHPFARRTLRSAEGAAPRPARTLHDLTALYERTVLIEALARNGFSRKRAAVSLGVSTNYLWRRMRLLKIDFAALPRTTPGRPRKKLT